MSRSNKQKSTPSQLLGFFALFLALCATLGLVLSGLLMPVAATVGITARAATDSFTSLPDDFEILEPSEQSVILASDGTQLARFYAEDRIIVPEDKISQDMKNAIVAVEDRRFYQHHGVDGQGIIRAFFTNISKGNTQGASTLTQQLVKNTLIENGLQNNDQAAIMRAQEPTIGRKIREMNYALALEKRWSKKEILARYLNIAPFGSNVYGVEAASLLYFSIHAKDLNKSQAALLAGITQSPVAYDPLRNPQLAEKRRNVVASRMLGEKFITKAEYDQIVATPVKDILKPSKRQTGCAAAGNAAYFCRLGLAQIMNSDLVGNTIAERRKLLMRGGITITTTLDPRIQKAAYEAITKQVPVGDPSGFKIAVTAIQPGTGNILAMAQNTNFGPATAKDPGSDYVSYNSGMAGGGGLGRQPGSSFKPMTMGAFFEANHGGYDLAGGKYNWGPKDFISTCPEAGVGAEHTYANVGGMSPAKTTVLKGLNWSINTTFLGMAAQVHDLCKIRDFAIRAGAVDGTGQINGFTPSSVLGTNSVPPLNMANAYATFAASGKRCQPRAILEIKDRNGKLIAKTEPKCEQTIDPMVAKKMARMLNMNNDFYKSQGYANAGRPAASKTGTTNNASDAWLVGFTPQIASAVWMGNPKGLIAMHNVRVNGRFYDWVYGSTIPAAAWADFMRNANAPWPIQNFDQVNVGGPKKIVPGKPAKDKKSDKKKPETAPKPEPKPAAPAKPKN
ncbi:hypothetical protein BSR29_00625 [Boudabousia liubingyangii]|uniref:Uncharacterized protein n=1 Tax=Boudabousia liubingyangii TaxID=1921764 RepID=A0A1Q5PPW9_9ACTO|nr:transglycosylase domain-containing protein [Boudabousia liubingyangii]OKL49500.1 hypothetical protein BSR29_00625 [Boudabousia liubingyangii]